MRLIRKLAQTVVQGLGLLLLTQLLALSIGGEALTSSSSAMVYAACAVLTGYLLLPLPVSTEKLLWWSVLTTLVAWLLSSWHNVATTPLLPALAAGLLIWLLGSLVLLGTALWGHLTAVHQAVLILLCLATTTPLWLGPIAERFAEIPAVVNAIVAASPLSYLATAAGDDYLRGVWFYQHTPLGSLHYVYPSALLYSGVCLLFGLICLWSGRRVWCCRGYDHHFGSRGAIHRAPTSAMAQTMIMAAAGLLSLSVKAGFLKHCS